MAITGFRRGAAERFFNRGDARRINPEHVRRVRNILVALDASDPLGNLSSPGYRLHPMKGNRKGEWSVRVSHGWRVTFRTDGKNAWDVQYENYHHWGGRDERFDRAERGCLGAAGCRRLARPRRGWASMPGSWRALSADAGGSGPSWATVRANLKKSPRSFPQRSRGEAGREQAHPRDPLE